MLLSEIHGFLSVKPSLYRYTRYSRRSEMALDKNLQKKGRKGKGLSS